MGRGNITHDQIRDSARRGNGARFQMAGDGTVVSHNVPMFDENGNLIDSGYPSSSIGGSGSGPGYPYTPPLLSMFPAWVNQGLATITTSNGEVVLRTPSSASDNWRGVFGPLAPPPYRYIVGVEINRTLAAASAAGIWIRNSSSGAAIAFYARGASTDIRISRLASPTSGAAIVEDFTIPTNSRCWFCLDDDGSQLVYRVAYGRDLARAITLRSESRSGYIVADQIGLLVYSSNSKDCVLACFDWIETVSS